MTRFEAIKCMKLEDMASILCDHYSEDIGCDKCIAQPRCWKDHNGMSGWLKEDIDDTGREKGNC